MAAALNSIHASDNANRVRGRLSVSDYAEVQGRAKRQMDAIKNGKGVASTSTPEGGNAGGAEPVVTCSGTGFILSQDGYLLTCNHVVQDSKTLTVIVEGTRYPASVVKTDAANDLALLKIQGKSFAIIPLRTDMPKKGAKVFTVGFPNPDLQGRESKYTEGTISSLSGIQDDIRTFQISVPVQPGNSGGALVDENGNAVGIVVAKISATVVFNYTGNLPENVNYAVKSIYALPLIQSVEGLSDRLVTPRNSLLPSNVSAAVERATCMVLVYK